jgi:hypothetical protein
MFSYVTQASRQHSNIAEAVKPQLHTVYPKLNAKKLKTKYKINK